MKIVLGIDIGTQSSKVLFYDLHSKKIVGLATAKHDLISDATGLREQEAQWWIEALLRCLDQISPTIKSAVEAVGISGQQHGFVAIDEKGSPLYKVKLWCDTSTAEECDEITQKFGGPQKLFHETGNLLASGYTASKILWLKKNHPVLYQRMRWVLLPHDYLNFWLSGAVAMEYGDASGTGLFDIRRRQWHRELADSIDSQLYEKLPPLIKSEKTLGWITAQAATKTGLPEGVPVSTGGGDNMMGALGTGTVHEGMLTMSMGTSGTLYGYSEKPITDPEGILASFCSSTGGWLPLLCTMNCTVATELTRNLFQLSVEEIDTLAAKAPVGAQGITLLPFFNGERVPALPQGEAAIMGINSSNYKRENIARAALESALYGMKIGLERFRQLGFNAEQIRMIGGGAKSPLWPQMAADLLNIPVLIPQQSETAAFGAALQAYWMLRGGGIEELHAIVQEHVPVDETQSCTPREDAHEAYEVNYGLYKERLEALKLLYK